MACCGSNKDATTARIDNELRKADKDLQRDYKILLLGAGESGKSTVAKQMQIIHAEEGNQPFTEQEVREYVPVIYANVLQSLCAVLEYMAGHGLKLRSKARAFAEEMAELYARGNCQLNPELGEKITIVYKDKAFQKALSNSYKFQFPERVVIFFEDMQRICAPDYVPTLDDILSARRRTTGVREMVFKSRGNTYRMVDVGGQRSERRKWFHFFESVTAVIFVTAISEYNLTMYEDNSSNRMHDSLALFREIANSQWFNSSAIVLFLNKKDLFKEKIGKYPLTTCFEDYDGQNTYDDAIAFIQKKFLAVCESKSKIFVHATCATDTENIRVVFAAIEDTVLSTNLGLIV